MGGLYGPSSASSRTKALAPVTTVGNPISSGPSDGLLVQRIALTLSYLPRMTLIAYYLFKPKAWHHPIREQCEAIDCTKSAYWQGLQAGEEAVSSGLKLLDICWTTQPHAFSTK
jgi:hypothetical protein